MMCLYKIVSFIQLLSEVHCLS